MLKVGSEIVVIETLLKPVLGMLINTLALISAVKLLLNVVLFKMIRSVVMENSPTNTFDSFSSDSNNKELELLVWFAFRISQDSLDSAPMMASIISSTSCRVEKHFW